eukprot:TRINITY_DN8958_c0_g1_i1.p1 TRINITY_DN8958_c0_g1~~TRINITY_DN8958_c0_g1_i1.p1  ORF type:complete len:194 (+),score=44.48 TRINITY_DN8958_c0_g1_i1:100-681(+)
MCCTVLCCAVVCCAVLRCFALCCVLRVVCPARRRFVTFSYAVRVPRCLQVWTDVENAVGHSVTILDKPPPRAPAVEPENKVMVSLGRSGAIRDGEDESLRDAVLVYNKKDDNEEYAADSGKLIFNGHDDQRPVMTSWTHPVEVRTAVVGEFDGSHVVCVGDSEGAVMFLRLEKYTPQPPPPHLCDGSEQGSQQ